MRTKLSTVIILAVSLLGLKLGIQSATAQTEPLSPPEISSTPLPSPDPPPLLPTQEETIRQLIEKEIKEGREISDRVDREVSNAFGLTLGLLNVLITLLIAIPIGTGFVLWWLRQSVIDRLVRDVRQQFQAETERLVRQQLEQEVSTKFQQQISDFELEIQQLRSEFEHRLHSLYQDAESDKTKIVQELEQLVASVDPERPVSPAIEHRLQELTDQLEALKTSNTRFSTHDHLKEGEALYLGRRHPEAIAAYQAALSLDPDSVEGWIGLAKSLGRDGQYEAALHANEALLQRHPHHAQGWFGKGYVLTDMQQYEDALESLDKATKLDPNRSHFWQRKGYVLAKLQQYGEALDCLDQALRLNPQSAGTYYIKAFCYVAQNQSELALEYLKEAICRYPSFQQIVETDPDFDPIRQMPAFQGLLGAKG